MNEETYLQKSAKQAGRARIAHLSDRLRDIEAEKIDILKDIATINAQLRGGYKC